jgi:hypothetical protein
MQDFWREFKKLGKKSLVVPYLDPPKITAYLITSSAVKAGGFAKKRA